MKLEHLVESVLTVLDTIDEQCETNGEACARYLATLMVLRDMGKLLKDESNPLQQNTYIDYLYGSPELALKAINHFYNRIQQNPRARRLFSKYELQFMDAGYGHVVMRTRIKSLRPYFEARKQSRLKFHEDTVVNNVIQSQDKIRKDYDDQYDLTDEDKVYNDKTFTR